MTWDVPRAGKPSGNGPVIDELTAGQVAAVFARMSGLLLSSDKVDTALKLITALAVEMVPGTTGAGISLMDRHGERVTAAATDQVVEWADALQYQLGHGPCLTAWSDRVVVRVDDLAVDERWPSWSRPAAELGLRSALSAPMVAGPEPLGALKVYAAQPRSYGEREEQLLTMFASQAAMLISNMRTAQDAERASGQVAEALRGREVVELAKGIIMARDHVDERTAFLTLAQLAEQEHTTVRHTAERLAQSTVRRRR
ncbi:GAF and ANTAR domain-containing protein [Amycolatopsis vastitatis]|uniref:Transcription antitermination regulator n=1 Tax=Amycolatopsis vastitatis TaxID=1905142 RepID=A0A229SVA4_9PSEU|nr:GAF and ANTAR domain-containing protein [Amycolatopsis vastitatis]OXM62898.1 transcription antitermination regulator [Amycolatopsis vastitatis]